MTFDIIKKLGAGGMADVFLARANLATGVKEVALKRIRVTLDEQPDLWKQFEREASILGLLHHPNLVALEAFGQDASGPYLALEYIAGAPASRLRVAAERAGLKIPAVAAAVICRDAAAGVSYAHDLEYTGGRGVLHRDLSPDNLLVSYAGVCKVNDFGIARLEHHTRLTATGEVRGKLPYTAPEMFSGAAHSQASDAFALAATLYKVVSGEAAFGGNTDAEVMRKLMFVTPTPLDQVRDDLPEPLVDWVRRALAAEPTARPRVDELVKALPEPTANDRRALSQWVEMLEPAGGGEERETRATPSVRDVARPPLPRRPLPLRLVAVALGCLAVGSAGVFVAWREDLTIVTSNEPDTPAVAPAPAPAPVAVVAEPPKPEPPKPAPAIAKKGTLDVRVTPYAEVFVDGDSKGLSPLKPIELLPGSHVLMLVNGQLDARKTYDVKIEAGKKTRIDADLRAP